MCRAAEPFVVSEKINQNKSQLYPWWNDYFVPPVVLLTSTVTHTVPLPTSPSHLQPLKLLRLGF